MRNNEMSTLDRLTAADPALAVTEDELARSREMSLAVMATDAEQLAVGGSIGDSHQRPVRRPLPVLARYGLAAAAAAVMMGVVVTASLPTNTLLEDVPVGTQPAAEPHNSASNPPGVSPLPEITGSPTPTVEPEIVTGGAGKLAASTTGIDNLIAGGIYMRPDVLRTEKLEADQNGCIGNGLLFPTGTKVTDAGLLMPDGAFFSIGDVISYGGLEVNSKDVGACADGRPLIFVEDVRPYPHGIPGA
ncbi:hypothetical protein [Arthrobacter sp. D5-1]|uniref:hypothetical protein n=1 Tax=Arthrobacter sp. D5-1 TaxID=1477518 RepID=UPI001A99357F|nr:hypothetical protein [Arthrobacter sp. D5-1]QSZ50718.1 hypothetical protein AYX22_21520 [Arthrobacter sp. D5-1]